MTLFTELLLLVYAALLIVLTVMGHVAAAAVVGIVGFLLLLVYSLCWAAKKGDCQMEQMARKMREDRGE